MRDARQGNSSGALLEEENCSPVYTIPRCPALIKEVGDVRRNDADTEHGSLSRRHGVIVVRG